MNRMNRTGFSIRTALIAALIVLTTASCASHHQTSNARNNAALISESKSAMQNMLARDSRLKPLIEQSAGYAVFPTVGKGGGLGHGAIFTRGGNFAGTSRITRGSLLGIDGSSSYDAVVILQTNLDVARFMNATEFTSAADSTIIAGDASAVVTDDDSTLQFDNGVAVFAMPKVETVASAGPDAQDVQIEKPAIATTNPTTNPATDEPADDSDTARLTQE